MFTTHIERFCDCIDELKPIFIIHAKELSEHIKHNMPLDPDYDQYRKLENDGKLLYISLRYDGKLVGYFSGFLVNSLHYRVWSLSLDLFYVVPQYRGKFDDVRGGQLLIDAIKKEANRLGIRCWTMGRKAAKGNHFEKLLKDNGFELFEIHYIYWF